MTTDHRSSPRAGRLAAGLAAVLIVSACAGGDAAGGPDTERSASGGGAPTTGRSDEPEPDALEAEIRTLLEAAMEPGAMDWTSYGVAGDPTAVTAGVRMEGRDDLLVVVGTQVDGSEAANTDSLFVGSIAEALVQTVAFQLVDEGALDLDATVDAWAPDMPAADVTTVQSVVDMTTGWSRFGDPGDGVVRDDLERRWTLSEVVALIGPSVTVDPNPSVATTDPLTTSIVLGHVLEQVTGAALADLVDDRIAEPLGLDDTAISDDPPADDHRHGVVDLGGSVADTSMVPFTAYLTWHAATFSAVSSVPDLLDLLDAWQSGALFRTDRSPGQDRFSADRATSTVDPGSYEGLGVPFNGYCPCTPTRAGTEVTGIGRTPSAHWVGVDMNAVRYGDGITVVVHFNSGQTIDRTQTRAVADAIHTAAAGSA